MPDFDIGVTEKEAEYVKRAAAFAQRESDDLDDAILQDVRSAAGSAEKDGVLELSRGELEELSEALADYSIDALDGATPSSFDDVATRVFRYVEHGQDYDPERDSALSVTEEEEEEPATTTIEFGSRPAANEVRDEYEKHLADDDDRREKEVVIHTGGLTRAEMDAIKADAAESKAVNEQTSTSVPLTDGERERIKELDGFDRTTTTKSWESAKGVFEREGVADRFRDAIGALTDGDDPAEQAEQWVRDLKSEGSDRSGGARDVGEEDEQQKRKEQKAAARVQEEGCNHAREKCKHGNPEACEHLKNVCGMEEEAVDALLSDDREALEEQTDQQELVTVGGDQFPEMEVTPQEAGALRRSWTGYKSAVSEVADALDTVREETTNARRALSGINAIREAHDQGEMHGDRLHDLMDALGEMPESMPEIRTLAHYGAFGDDDAPAGETADLDAPAGGPPLDHNAAPIRRREGEVPEEINGWGYNGTETVTFEDPDRGGEITVEAWQWYCPTNDRAVGLAGPVERYAAEGYPYVVLDRFRDTDDNIRWKLRYIAEDWNAALTEVGRQIERRENKGLDDVDRPSPPLDVDTTAVDARQHRRAKEMRDRHRHRQVEARTALDEYDPDQRRRVKRGVSPNDQLDDAAGIIPGRDHRPEDRDRPERMDQFRDMVAQDGRRLKPDPRLDVDVQTPPNRSREVVDRATKREQWEVVKPWAPFEWDGGQYKIRISGDDPADGSAPYEVVIVARNGRKVFQIASGLRDLETAREVAREFMHLVAPSQVILDRSDATLPEAAAKATRKVSTTEGGLSRYTDAGGSSRDPPIDGDALLYREGEPLRRDRDPPIDGDALLYREGEPLRRDRGDADDGREQFAQERQGTLGGTGVESEEAAEEKQVTLTGADEEDDPGALPSGWSRRGSNWIAGPYTIQLDSHDGDRWNVRLLGINESELLADGLASAEQAEKVARGFAERVDPHDVSFHNADSTVTEAAAAAKKEALEDTSGPLDQFRGGSGNPHRPVDVVMTAIGGSGVTQAIEQSDALLGYEASRTEPPAGTVEFVDFPFTADETSERRIEMLKEAVERHRPKIAVAPDIEGAVDVDTAAEIGDDLLRLGADHVVMVPKDAAPTEVPDRFRVGFPAADFGSDAGHFITEYAAFDGDGIHVLGASPTVQLDLASYGLDVRSVDGSSVMIGAENHDIWTPESPHWEGVTGRSDLYDRLRVSLNNVVGAWKQRHGQDAHIVDSNEFNDRIEEEAEQATREVRRRRAGRGPPVADPHTGELQREDGTAFEEGATQPEEIDKADLNRRDREMIQAIEQAAPGRVEQDDGADDSDDDGSEEPDDQQLRLRT